MTIKEILEKLKHFDITQKIMISDGTYLINDFGCDKGCYNDMFIGHVLSGADNLVINKVNGLINLLNKSLQVGSMIGYKGGSSRITEDTIVTIGNYGISGYNISDIREKDGIVYLIYEETITREVWNIN